MIEQVQTDETAVLADDPLAALTEEESVIGAKLLPILTAKIALEADVRYGREYRTKIDEYTEANKTALRKAIADMQEVNKPLDDAELAKLLGQEYGVFSVRLTVAEQLTDFTVRELPVAAEKRLMLAIKSAIGPLLQAISADDWKSLAGASMLDRVTRLLDLVPETLSVLCRCVVICLDHTGSNPVVTAEWVENTMGLNRILMILTAQVSASRYRDFFSLGFRLFQQSRMLTP